MENTGTALHDNSPAAFAQTVHLLKDERIQQFIADVREREGFVHPVDRIMYMENLARLGATEGERRDALVELAKEAIRPAAEYWIEVFREEVEEEVEPPEEWSILADTYKIESPEKLMRATLQFFGRGVGYVSKESARVIARYIVAGFMEVPPAVGLPSGFVTPFSLGGGNYMILAGVSSISDLSSVIRKMKKLYSELFVKGARHRLPDKGRETLWLRYCAHVAGRDEEVEAGEYRYLAELYLELHPKDRPAGQPLDPAYEKAVQKHSWRIRKNVRYWEEVLRERI